jgi:hypothetical protein
MPLTGVGGLALSRRLQIGCRQMAFPKMVTSLRPPSTSKIKTFWFTFQLKSKHKMGLVLRGLVTDNCCRDCNYNFILNDRDAASPG